MFFFTSNSSEKVLLKFPTCYWRETCYFCTESWKLKNLTNPKFSEKKKSKEFWNFVAKTRIFLVKYNIFCNCNKKYYISLENLSSYRKISKFRGKKSTELWNFVAKTRIFLVNYLFFVILTKKYYISLEISQNFKIPK